MNHRRGYGGGSRLLGAQTSHTLDASRDELRDATAAVRNGDVSELAMPAVLASAKMG
jgi:hypothetical protein